MLLLHLNADFPKKNGQETLRLLLVYRFICNNLMIFTIFLKIYFICNNNNLQELLAYYLASTDGRDSVCVINRQGRYHIDQFLP